MGDGVFVAAGVEHLDRAAEATELLELVSEFKEREELRVEVASMGCLFEGMDSGWRWERGSCIGV